MQVVKATWHLIVPPLERRTPSSFTPLLFLFTNTFMVGASYLALHRPRLSLQWRLLYAVITILLLVHDRLAYHMALPWKRSYGPIDVVPWYATLDAMSAGAILPCISMICEALFWMDPRRWQVRGAQEYRHFLRDRHAELGIHELQLKEMKLTGNGTYERPQYFPGTTEALYKDIISARGLGYHLGLRQRGLVAYEGGYNALIASQKLQEGDPEHAKQVKRQQIWQVFRTFLPCCLTVVVCTSMLTNPYIVTPSAGIPDPTYRYTAPVSSSFLPTWLQPWLITAIQGTQIVASLQTSYALWCLVALWMTPAPHIPITVGRWLPLLFQQPHRSTSITDMWGVHWHGLMRRLVTVTCMQPSKRLAAYMGWPAKVGRAIGVIASFLYSGLGHELMLEALLPHLRRAKVLRRYSVAELRAAGYGFGACHWASTRFFLSMGILIIIEDVWTGTVEPILAVKLWHDKSSKLVQGRLRLILAWCYCMGTMVWFGRELADVWRLNGFAATPNVYRGLVRILVPLV